MSQVVYARTRRTHMSCRRFEPSTSKNADQQIPRPHARVAACCLLSADARTVRPQGLWAPPPVCMRYFGKMAGRAGRASDFDAVLHISAAVTRASNAEL